MFGMLLLLLLQLPLLLLRRMLLVLRPQLLLLLLLLLLPFKPKKPLGANWKPCCTRRLKENKERTPTAR